jgi:peptidoglycan/xylan/chitin deacetylase (PgdA/CDA1 family)
MSDDGYANALDTAADVLEDLRLPWTLFISTEHIETGELNPLVLARFFIHFAPCGSHVIPHLGGPIKLGSTENRMGLVAPVLRALKRLPAPKAREAVATMAAAFPPDRLGQLRARFPSEQYLTWSQVEALHKRGVEIGAHAHWHWPMNEWQSADHLFEQATLPRRRIASQIGDCRYFAYPFGNAGDVSRAARQAVRDAGYSNAFTTLSGTLRAGLDPWLLPRYGLRAQEHHLPSLLPMLRLADVRIAHHAMTSTRALP